MVTGVSTARDCCLGNGLSFQNGGTCRQCIGEHAVARSSTGQPVSGVDPEIEEGGAHIEWRLVRPCGARSTCTVHSVVGVSGEMLPPGTPITIPCSPRITFQVCPKEGYFYV